MIGARPPEKSLGGLVVFEPQSHLLIGSKPNYFGAKEGVAKEQLKHRHPLSTAQNIAWGFFAIAMNKESTLVIGYQDMAWKPSVYT